MSADDLVLRVQRLYAAVGTSEETDISKFAPKVINDSHRIGFYQDWSGELSEAGVANIAHSLIHNIAGLRDNLKKWAARNGKDETQVDAAFNNSEALKIIMDLSNNDKHGYPPRNGGYSGKSPKVDRVKRTLRMTTKPEKGSSIRLTFTWDGIPKVSGDGTAKVIISGDILDGDDHKIGDLYETALEAIKVWEGVLSAFSVKL
jgi:hypothetical protein